jgi:adenylylsulfate kinase
MAQSNIIPHSHQVTKVDRNTLNGHPSKVIWFTGLSGSGKSTLASKLEEELHKLEWHTYLLDGDNVRMGLNKGLGFSLKDRTENIRRIGEVSKLFVDAGVLVIAAFVSPLKDDRDRVRALFPQYDFVEVFVDCPLAVCEKRDVKGLYQKARKGEIKDFTGISSPFENPENPELTIYTAEEDLKESVKKIISYLKVTHE